MNLLANLFLFFSLLPFISPLPTQSDVQLPAFVFGATIIALDLARGRVKLDWVDLMFVGVAIWSFCFVLPSGEFVLRQRAGLLMAFVIYYVAKKHAASFSPRTVYLAIIVGFAGVLAQWWRGDLFEVFAPRIIRTVKGIEGGRGVSGLSAEPSFLAGMAVVQALVLYYYYRIGRTSGRLLAVGCALAFIMVALSRSATGFVYLLLVGAVWLAYFAVKGLRLSVWVGSVALVTGVLLMITGPLATSRGGIALATLYQSPSTFVADGSLQERAVSLFLGAVALPYHPFGAGGGAYYHVALDMARIHNAERIFWNVRPDVIGGVLSSMGLYLAELGLVFIFFLAIIFWRSLRLDALHLALCALALVFIAATFSITCPLTWLPLGLAARPDGLRMRSATARA